MKTLNNSGIYPVFGGGDVQGFTDKYNREANTIIVSGFGHAGTVRFITKKFWLTHLGFSIIPSNRVLNKFLYYYLKHMQPQIQRLTSKGTLPMISKSNISTIKVPIPSLEIQEKIVEFLDQLVVYQEALSQELALRETQFKYYRNKLLSSQSLIELTNKLCLDAPLATTLNLTWCNLGEVADISTGASPTMKTCNNSGIYPVFGGGDVQGFIDIYNREAKTIVVARSGSNAGTVRFITKKFWLTDHGFAIIPSNKVLNKFLYHYLKYIQPQIQRLIFKGTFSMLTKSKISTIKVPIVSLSVQKVVVDILDKFESLVESLLPQEIEKRMQQLEYYRNKLLTFSVKYNKKNNS